VTRVVTIVADALLGVVAAGAFVWALWHPMWWQTLHTMHLERAEMCGDLPPVYGDDC
jgi:hypothetical protein